DPHRRGVLASVGTPGGYASVAGLLGAGEERMEALVRQAERLTGKRYLRAAPAGSLAGPPAGASVLVVDGNEAFRSLFGAALRSRFPDLPVHEAGTAEEALRQVRSHVPRVVFANFGLPGAGGRPLTRTICDVHPGVCSVVSFGDDLPEVREAAKDAGASHFLPKQGLDLGHLFRLVEEAIWGATPPAALRLGRPRATER
ncbi:MAG: response regulator, partial [Deferrisomatales bacterium]